MERYSVEIYTGKTIHAVIADRPVARYGPAGRLQYHGAAERCLCGMVAGIGGKARRWIGGWSAVTCKLCQRSPEYRAWKAERDPIIRSAISSMALSYIRISQAEAERLYDEVEEAEQMVRVIADGREAD